MKTLFLSPHPHQEMGTLIIAGNTPDTSSRLPLRCVMKVPFRFSLKEIIHCHFATSLILIAYRSIGSKSVERSVLALIRAINHDRSLHSSTSFL